MTSKSKNAEEDKLGDELRTLGCARLAVSNKSRLGILKTIVFNAFENTFGFLKFVLLLAMFGFDIYTVVPFFVFTIGVYGLWSVLGLLVTQSPIISLIVEEIWREYHTLPPSEAFEISPERWAKSVKEYVELVEKERSKTKHV